MPPVESAAERAWSSLRSSDVPFGVFGSATGIAGAVNAKRFTKFARVIVVPVVRRANSGPGIDVPGTT
jgi:hypothetical protein